MLFPEGLSECLNFGLLSNDLNVLESLFPLKNLLNCVINDDGETIILRALKFSKNELVLDIISKYKNWIELEMSLVNFVNGWTCFHYIASQKSPHILHSQINLTEIFLNYNWKESFERGRLPCKLITGLENEEIIGIFSFFYSFFFFNTLLFFYSLYK
jgi:hypothetical protein